MELRPATHDDIEEVVRLLSILRMKECTVNEILPIFSQTVDSRFSDIILCEIDGKVIGMIAMNQVLKLNRIEARLDDLIVDSSARGKGAGTALLNAGCDWSWRAGCYKLEMTSRPQRGDSHRLYEKVGFAIRESNIYTKFSPTTDYVKTKVI